jgi:D-glycerate 3-kinase
VHQNGADRPILVGLNGSQGSGKTTLCDYVQTALAEQYGKRALALSIDDFYLTREQRLALASNMHPLCATRGVPGTHDMGLLGTTVAQLLDSSRSSDVVIPRFNKATDDRAPAQELERWSGGLDVLLLEGWCLGVLPQTDEMLVSPINALEANEDADGVWRQWSNRNLAEHYVPFYASVDFWVMLAAPDFDCVLAWRTEQEEKLRQSLSDTASSNALQSPQALQRFVQHYERLTRQCLATLPDRVDYLLSLDAHRTVRAVSQRKKPGS